MASPSIKQNRSNNITRVINLNTNTEIDVLNTTHKDLVKRLSEKYKVEDVSETARLKMSTVSSLETLDEATLSIYVIDKELWDSSEDKVLSDIRTMSLEQINHVVCVEGDDKLIKKIKDAVDSKIVTNLESYIEEL